MQGRFQDITSRVWTVCHLPDVHYKITTHNNKRMLQFQAPGMLSHTVRCFPRQVAHNSDIISCHSVSYFLFLSYTLSIVLLSFDALSLLFSSLPPFISTVFYFSSSSFFLYPHYVLSSSLPSALSFHIPLYLFISYVSPLIYPKHFKTLTSYSQPVIVIGFKPFCKYLNCY